MKNIMEFIRTIREKQQTSRQMSIREQAHSCICLDDFDSQLYITYNGTPLIPIDSNLSQDEVMEKLQTVRDSYTNYKMKQLCSPKVASLL